MGYFSLKDTKSEAGEQVLPLCCRAKALVKGVFFQRHREGTNQGGRRGLRPGMEHLRHAAAPPLQEKRIIIFDFGLGGVFNIIIIIIIIIFTIIIIIIIMPN